MPVIHTSIEVEVPARIAYDQCTQFEDFPGFMEGIVEVHQTDEVNLRWAARIAGVTREWDAKITEQIPDQLLAWTSTGGTRNDGLATLDALAAHRCEAGLRMGPEPDGVADPSRVTGSIPVVLVFVEPLVGPEVDHLVEDLGVHLAEFGRHRVQLLVVANVDEETAGLAASWTEGDVRVLADADGALADRYGVTYSAGAPTAVLIDSDGDVGAIWVEGPGSDMVDALLRRVQRLASS